MTPGQCSGQLLTVWLPTSCDARPMLRQTTSCFDCRRHMTSGQCSGKLLPVWLSTSYDARPMLWQSTYLFFLRTSYDAQTKYFPFGNCHAQAPHPHPQPSYPQPHLKSSCTVVQFYVACLRVMCGTKRARRKDTCRIIQQAAAACAYLNLRRYIDITIGDLLSRAKCASSN